MTRSVSPPALTEIDADVLRNGRSRAPREWSLHQPPPSLDGRGGRSPMLSRFAVRTAEQTRHLLFEAVVDGFWGRRRSRRWAGWTFDVRGLAARCGGFGPADVVQVAGAIGRPGSGARGSRPPEGAKRRLQLMRHFGKVLFGMARSEGRSTGWRLKAGRFRSGAARRLKSWPRRGAGSRARAPA